MQMWLGVSLLPGISLYLFTSRYLEAISSHQLAGGKEEVRVLGRGSQIPALQMQLLELQGHSRTLLTLCPCHHDHLFAAIPLAGHHFYPSQSLALLIQLLLFLFLTNDPLLGSSYFSCSLDSSSPSFAFTSLSMKSFNVTLQVKHYPLP